MGNMCCRRVVYSPNGGEVDHNRCHQQQQQLSKAQTMSNAYHSAGDDCAINELLEGRMDLDVILPDGKQVRLTVERRTPMMDLLVQAASATKISPVGHVIHVFRDNNKERNSLHYKPSTPIGSLDTNTICIVPKKDIQDLTSKRGPRTANRPFEPTFRVQVHLPRNQLTVVRVSPRVKISELRDMVCQEKSLEACRYQLVRPSDPAQALSGDLTLAEYGSTEITLLSNTSIESNICNSTSHIMPYSKRVEEQKKKKGILRLLAEDTNKKREKNPVINGNQNLTQATKTCEIQVHQGRYKPKKRRPAPPPPPPMLPEAPFHSRQSSSDSSGYHEATSSFLHEEHCPSTDEKASSDSSGVSSLDAKVTTVEATTLPNAKKRKAPPPPPPPIQVLEDRQVLDTVKSEEIHKTEPRSKAQTILENNACSSIEEISQDDMKKKEIQPKNKSEKLKKIEEKRSKSVLEEDKNKLIKKTKIGEPVTRVALVALNARIEQDVTQQEIASSIQAAFHSLDSPQRVGPSLLAIKQRTCPSKSIENRLIQNDVCSESTKEIILPQVQDKNLSVDSSKSNFYPLQKSSALLTLNLETKDNVEIGIETVLPPPSEFRSDEKEVSLTDDELEKESSTTPFSGECKSLKRSTSLLSIADVIPKHPSTKLKNQNLQRSLSDIRCEDKEEVEGQQEKLQREYIELQQQFILWQQQVLKNHAMLSQECIVPQYARTLRQSHSLPDGEDYSNDTPGSVTLVSRSLSYEPTKSICSTFPRSAINIPSLELKSVPINNESSTLRLSKNKNFFKPPQVRVSTKNRQRLPPEIKKDGELDISDDKKILSTILPTFESLRFITEVKDEEATLKNSSLQSDSAGAKLGSNCNKLKEEVKHVMQPQNPNKLVTLPKPNLKMNNGRPIQNGHISVNSKCVNRNNGDVKALSTSANTIEQSVCSQPPPPPPLPSLIKKQNGIVTNKCNGNQIKIKKEIQPQSDPREQLMKEIRRFGGGSALRKIPLAI